jgi:3-dehydroquinate synthase class II
VQVHSYCTVPGGKTAYLSELKSGSEVVVVKADGRQRSALVGRVKIETRPLVSRIWEYVLIQVSR